MAGKAEPVNNFWCIEITSECPRDLLGNVDCTGCKYHNDCDACGRYNTKLCSKCAIRIRNKGYEKLGYTKEDIKEMMSNNEEVDWM